MPQEAHSEDPEGSEGSQETHKRSRSGNVHYMDPAMESVFAAMSRLNARLQDLDGEHERVVNLTRDLATERADAKHLRAEVERLKKFEEEVGELTAALASKDVALASKDKEAEMLRAEKTAESERTRLLANYRLTLGLLAGVPIAVGASLLMAPVPEGLSCLPYVSYLMIALGVVLGVLAVVTGKPTRDDEAKKVESGSRRGARKKKAPEGKPAN